jgi:hypothetical protein
VIRLVTARALAELRIQAARSRAMSARVIDLDAARRAAVDKCLQAQQDAVRALVAQVTAEAAYEALLEDTVAGLSRLRIAASHPGTGRAVQAEIALVILRNQIARARESGDPDLIDSFLIVAAVLGEDLMPGDGKPAEPPAEESPVIRGVSDTPDNPGGSPS